MKFDKFVCAAILGAALVTACGRTETTSTTSAPRSPAASTTAQSSGPTTVPQTEVALAGPEASRSAGQTVSDAAVTAKVKSALLQAPEVKGTDVNVDTVNGTVTLKGQVETQAQADRAVQIARSIEGVSRVDSQQLTVKAKS